jgi:hypothetical protein
VGQGTGRRLAVLPGDVTSAFYGDTYLYFLAPRFAPSTYYLEMNPGVANGVGSRLADDLRHTDFVVLDPRYDRNGREGDAGRPRSTAASQVLAQEFTEISRHGPWRLLARR